MRNEQRRAAGVWSLTPHSPFRTPHWQGAVAQPGERLVCNQEVVGSIPIGSTIRRRPGGAMADARRSLGKGGPTRTVIAGSGSWISD